MQIHYDKGLCDWNSQTLESVTDCRLIIDAVEVELEENSTLTPIIPLICSSTDGDIVHLSTQNEDSNKVEISITGPANSYMLKVFPNGNKLLVV